MNKTMMAMALLLAMSVSQASAQTQRAASTAAAPAMVLASVAHAQLPAVSKAEGVARPTLATVPAARETAPKQAVSETNAGGLQALQWIYAAVTCHDTSACDQRKNGVSLNFSMPY